MLHLDFVGKLNLDNSSKLNNRYKHIVKCTSNHLPLSFYPTLTAETRIIIKYILECVEEVIVYLIHFSIIDKFHARIQ